MDNAVALVEAYLYVNGYFTVTEYPVIEAASNHNYRMVTDLDIMAVRFPDAGRLILNKPDSRRMFAPDSALNCPVDCIDMIVGEVKEGRAELNRGARDPAVLRAMFVRFGCCHEQDAGQLVQQLLRKGSARTPAGHLVRLIAFGTQASDSHPSRYTVISLGHVVQFLQDYLRQHWAILHHAQFKHPAFGFLAMLEKALHDQPSETEKKK
ncbi:MAG: hypothetical protein U1C48_10670 [Methylotenera sp.]|nr:hypothetical protein [Methylotenera sp.]